MDRQSTTFSALGGLGGSVGGIVVDIREVLRHKQTTKQTAKKCTPHRRARSFRCRNGYNRTDHGGGYADHGGRIVPGVFDQAVFGVMIVKVCAPTVREALDVQAAPVWKGWKAIIFNLPNVQPNGANGSKMRGVWGVTQPKRGARGELFEGIDKPGVVLIHQKARDLIAASPEGSGLYAQAIKERCARVGKPRCVPRSKNKGVACASICPTLRAI